MRERARALLDRFRVSDPPVPVEEIARGLDMKLVVQSFGDLGVSGFYLRRGPDQVIGVNADHHRNRRRFTIAHELGHALTSVHEDMHVDGALLLRDAKSATGEDRGEVEANTFAAELLMPADMLTRAIEERGGIDVENSTAVRSLADKFGVSSQALLIRLASPTFVMANARTR